MTLILKPNENANANMQVGLKYQIIITINKKYCIGVFNDKLIAHLTYPASWPFF